MIIRVAGTSIAALALIAGTSAFSSHPAARQSHARPASARHSSRLSTHPMIPARLPATPAAASAIGNVRTIGSNNWSGYAVTRRGVKFRKVTAKIIVPFLRCKKTPGTFSSAWVGLDGFNSRTVEQDGISANCTRRSKPRYAAWWGVFPRPEVQTRMVVRPGDSITATVTFNPRTRRYRMTVTDNTRHHHFSVSRKCAGSLCKRSSAEFISEAPTLITRSGLVQSSLADYGRERFAHVTITSSTGRRGGIFSRRWTATRIVQIGFRSHHVIAFPTAVHDRSFRNIWLGKN
jgi:hypothetical protein